MFMRLWYFSTAFFQMPLLFVLSRQQRRSHGMRKICEYPRVMLYKGTGVPYTSRFVLLVEDMKEKRAE